MTDKEINRATINGFLARCINRAAASAIDAEFGLRVVGVLADDGSLRFHLDDDSIVLIEFTRYVTRDPMDAQRFFDAIKKGKSADARA